VFSRLARLRIGDEVAIRRTDGSTVKFTVERIERHSRRAFPVASVYWPTLAPELRLITCGGQYIRARGGYQENVIVFATLAREAARRATATSPAPE
jgi:hypothetical protein